MSKCENSDGDGVPFWRDAGIAKRAFFVGRDDARNARDALSSHLKFLSSRDRREVFYEITYWRLTVDETRRRKAERRRRRRRRRRTNGREQNAGCRGGAEEPRRRTTDEGPHN